jgi:sulfite reductase (NADPH) flavoprotein alpha-component
LVLLWLLAGLAFANERHSDPDGCFSCHGLPGLEYLDKNGVRRVATILEADYYGSLHGSVPCKDCHRKIERYPHKPEEGYVDCSESCHVEEPSKGKAFTHKEVVDEFKTSAHGSGHAPGATKDFHGGNRLQEMNDQQNPSCRRCHSNTPYIKDSQLPKFKEAFGHMDTECGSCHQGETWRNQFSGHILRRLVGKNYNKMEANALCVDCHGDAQAMTKVKLEDPETKKKEPADFRWVHATDSYDKTLHGRFLAVNDESGAGCIDCHAPKGFRHGIQRDENITSPTHPSHLTETCSQAGCHGYSEMAANDNFTKTDVHATDMLRLDILTALPINPFSGDASNWYRAAWILGPLAVVLALSNFLWTLLGFSGGSPAAVVGGDRFQRVMLGSGAGRASWLQQWLARLRGDAGGMGSAAILAAVDPEAPITGMTLLYASQTGNGEGIAADLTALAEARGYPVKAMDMADYEPADLVGERLLFIISSTHGDGDPPIAAEKLHGYLYGESAPRLERLKFGVFALGDSSYKHFCRAGKDFDAFLERLGGKRVLHRVDADVDFEEPAAQWMQAVLDTYHQITGDPGRPVELSMAPGGAKTAGSEGYGKNNPYPARLIANINLNGEGSAKETRHLEIELAGSGLAYEAGDALGVLPRNCPEYLEELLSALSMDGYASVTLGTETLSLREALYTRLDSTALSRVLMEKYAALVDSGPLQDLLAADEARFQHYIYGRDLMDLVSDFSTGNLAPQDFVGILRRLPPRLYSISSSPKFREGEVHLTVAVVRYQAHNRLRGGVCSNFLAKRMVPDERLGVYVQPNKHFRLPEDAAAPVIMVGPGTGIAPFRAFVQEREVTGANGKNWLFFGDQKRDHDYLYADEWEQRRKQGVLARLDLAFSRDQQEKIYVQTRMQEAGKELYDWLEQGAYFYVCGDASRMANDVHQALIRIVMEQGAVSRERAEEYIQGLSDARRYLRDVY